jgi:hypothetical protein
MLVAEIGTATTKIVAVDLQDGEYRLTARAETWSTLAAPDADAMIAIRHLLHTLEEQRSSGQTGEETGPLPPRVLAITSAAPASRIAVMALAAGSAREAINAARGTYSTVVHTLILQDAGSADEHWLSTQAALLRRAAPDLVLITGGLENGAMSLVERLAQLAALFARAMRPMPAMLYAGNGAAAERVRTILGDVTVVPNLLPTAIANRLEPARAALRAFHATHSLPALPGYDALQHAVVAPPVTVADAQGIMVRFLAERYGRRIMFLDTGATHSAGHLHADERYTQIVLADEGIGAGAPGLLEHVGAPAVARWLPETDAHVANRVFNRALHGSVVPTDRADILLDHALLRESFGRIIAALRAARPSAAYDLVVAAGAITRAPQPGLAALTLLDVLAVDDAPTTLAVDLYLDNLGLFAACGAIAPMDGTAAASVLEQDALNDGPFATVLVPQGRLVEGSQALEVELRSTAADGTNATQRVAVRGGEIVRLPLEPGARGTLRVQPVAGVSVGANAAGAEVVTDEGAVVGSRLGVIVDARPRPLRLPADDATRIAALHAALEALGALPSTPAPLEAMPVTAEAQTPTEVETVVADVDRDPIDTPVPVADVDAEAVDAPTLIADVDADTTDAPVALPGGDVPATATVPPAARSKARIYERSVALVEPSPEIDPVLRAALLPDEPVDADETTATEVAEPPRPVAVMKDDVPLPTEPAPKKRRFRWWR